MAPGLTTAHLNDDLFQEILNGIHKNATLKSWAPVEKNTEAGYTTTLTNSTKDIQKKRLIGIFLYKLVYTEFDNQEVCSKIVVLKSKAKGSETVKSMMDLVPEFADNFYNISVEFDFETSHRRELECICLNDESLSSILPSVYWSWVDEEQDINVYAMEYFDEALFYNLDTAMDREHQWKKEDILSSLKGVALLHGKFYGTIEKIPPNIKKYTKEISSAKIVSMLKESVKHNRSKGPDFWTEDVCGLAENILDNITEVSSILHNSEKTLVHGDFCTINLCLRRDGMFPEKSKLCLYDWEYSFIGNPQADVALFLCFVIPVNSDISLWHYYVEKYRMFLQENIGNKRIINADEFMKVFDMNMCDLFINLLNWFYCIVVPVYQPPFVKMLYSNLLQYTKYAAEKHQIGKIRQ